MSLTLVGLGAGGRAGLTLGAWDALRQAGESRYARRDPQDALAWLQSPEGGITFDAVFDGEGDAAIAAEILQAARVGDVMYALPGVAAPLQDPACALLAAQAQAEGIPVQCVPAVPESDPQTGFAALVGVMARLRDPEQGCPWDREQTPETLKRYVIEEAYEVVEAVESGDPAKLSEELGDLLLQVVFYAQLAREAGQFDIGDITRTIVDKLIRRHPHVFGDVTVSGTEQVLANWEQIKRREKGYEDRTSILDGIPAGLPALMRALEISRRVVKVGFEWPSVSDVLDKVEEEIAELRREIAAGDAARAADEMGDLLFTLVNVSRQLRIDPEDSLRRMTRRFADRFRHIEAHAAAQGRALSDLSLPEMEAVWQAAKSAQSGQS